MKQITGAVKEKILECEILQRGEEFTVNQLCARYGWDANTVRMALLALVDKDIIVRDNDRTPAKYWKRRRHWIDKARLNDPAGLDNARQWAEWDGRIGA